MYPVVTSLDKEVKSRFMGDIDISKIKQSKNIKKHKVPESEEHAKSIQQKGLLQPTLVRNFGWLFQNRCWQ